MATVVEKIVDVGRLRQIQPEWDDLWSRTQNATPFQHSAWLLPWWDTFGSGELFSFAVRHDRQLTGLGLFFLHTWQNKRQLTFLGNGVSDYLDILGDASLILEGIALHREAWDVCDLQDLAADSSLLRTAIPDPLLSKVCPQSTCSAIFLPEAVDSFRSGLPHGLKRNLRRYAAQLKAVGSVAYETATCGNGQSFIDALFDLHQSRWALKGGKGLLDGSDLERFHRCAAENLWKRGLVRLHGLRHCGSLIAVVYAFVHRQRAYCYLGGFDPAFSRFSPGALVLAYVLEKAISEGVAVFDFLRGEESYKADWGATKSVSSRLLLWQEP